MVCVGGALMVCACAFLAGPSSSPTPPTPAVIPTPTLPPALELAEGWNQISPGGDTACARGGLYSYFIRTVPASQKLLIYFEGGGGCYDAASCREGSHAFDDSIDPALPADNPSLKTYGVFALHDSRNPFADYNIAFINYCTGDGYLGHRTVSYSAEGQTFDVQHVGFTNAQTALAQVYRQFPAPEAVTVIGCSAGVIGSAFHAPYIMEQYKTLPITVIGDSGGGFVDGPPVILQRLGTFDLWPAWLPSYQALTPETFRAASFFTLAAQAYPQNTLALVDTTADGVQAGLLAQLGTGVTLAEVLGRNLQTLHEGAPNLRSFTGPGDYHCILERPEFYDYTVNGTALRDWVAEVQSGRAVADVAP